MYMYMYTYLILSSEININSQMNKSDISLILIFPHDTLRLLAAVSFSVDFGLFLTFPFI